MIRQLAHLNFVTNDLLKIIDFYVNKLGMEVKFTLDNKQGHPLDITLDVAIPLSLNSSIRQWQQRCGAATWRN